jgi:ABC transport system ATP-binding/permease protein
MGLLTLQEVSLTYGDRTLLNQVSMVVGATDRIGLLGANGSGKSTLTRILADEEQPDHGQRTMRRGLRIGFLEQEPAFDAAQSIVDVVRQGLEGRAATLASLELVHEQLASAAAGELDRLLEEQARLDTILETQGGHDIEHRVEAMIHNLGLADVNVTCGDLSGGERRRVALARLLLSAPDLLILDEPTNHLDAHVTDWLEDHLLQSRTPLILVTHDRYFLERLVTRTIELENGILYEYDGAYSAFLEARAARLDRDKATESTRANLLRRETEWMRRGPPARTTKSKARIGRYQDLVDAAPDRAGQQLEFGIPSGPRLGERVLKLSNVTGGYDEPLFRDLDIEIGARTRIGIVGPNGAGKSTFLKICTGELAPTSGTVHRGSTVKFASIDQRRSDLDESKSVLEEIAGKNDYVHVDGRTVRIESFLEQFLFPGAMKHSKIGTLSGGERNRVLLGKLLCADGNVVILDEPTNDLDLMTLRALEEALCAFPGVVLVVSHDRFFLDRIATRILHFDGDGNHRIHEGDLSLLLEKMAGERARVASAAATRPTPPPKRQGAKKRKLSTREHTELEALPDKIASVEAALARLDARLEDPALWHGGAADPHVVTAERAKTQAEVDELYSRWEELESVREAQ